jgi:hypothetical protein
MEVSFLVFILLVSTSVLAQDEVLFFGIDFRIYI